jgi:hypothetical protein
MPCVQAPSSYVMSPVERTLSTYKPQQCLERSRYFDDFAAKSYPYGPREKFAKRHDDIVALLCQTCDAQVQGAGALAIST